MTGVPVTAVAGTSVCSSGMVGTGLVAACCGEQLASAHRTKHELKNAIRGIRFPFQA